jgi:cytochrome P450
MIRKADTTCATEFMERDVLEDVTLSGNIQLKRGSATMIMSRLRDPTLYERPDEYDGYRFYRMRQQAGKDKVSSHFSIARAPCCPRTRAMH